MPSVWLSLLARLVAVAFGGLVIGALFGAAAGALAACAILLLLLLAHTAHLARLQRWLKSPEQRDIPDAWGAWGNVFVDLYRMLRREHKARARIEGDLEVFSQAAEASPDGLVFLDAEDHIVWCNRVAEQHLGLRGERDVGLLVTNLIRLPGFAEFIASALFRYLSAAEKRAAAMHSAPKAYRLMASSGEGPMCRSAWLSTRSSMCTSFMGSLSA